MSLQFQSGAEEFWMILEELLDFNLCWNPEDAGFNKGCSKWMES